jgi:hypothetical protein
MSSKNIITEFINNKNNDNAINLIYNNIKKVKNILITDKEIFEKFNKTVVKILNNNKSLKLTEQINNKDTDFIIIVGNDSTKRKLFIIYLLSFYLLNLNINIKERVHVGIDYEFNKQKIALMQINFGNIIWLINPVELDKQKDMPILIKYLMTNTNIYKILHGPDSLDIPYMYEIMFDNNKEVIEKFTRKLIDTRFLCEYFKLSIGPDKKCSIYDALKYFGTITPEKYDELNKIHDLMGPVQDVDWNIHTISSYHLKYALYDVLFLQQFLIDIYTKVLGETNYLVPSYKYVNHLIRFIYLERNGITNIIEDTKKETNPLHNYIIKHKNNNFTLITIFNKVMENFKICLNDTCKNNYIDLNFLLSVGYIGKKFTVLLKKIVYNILKDNFTVYKSKKEVMDNKLDINLIWDKLDKNKYNYISKLLHMFDEEAKKKILILYY